MKIQRFEAATAAEALQMAQAALGPDAVVLHSGPLENGPNGETRVEVVAAVDVQAATPPAAARPAAPASFPTLAPVTAPVTTPVTAPAARADEWQAEAVSLRQQLSELKALLSSSTSSQPPTPALLGTSMPSRLFGGDGAAFNGRTTEEISQRIREAVRTRTIEMRAGRSTAVALVGPTGVGKTTTAAKLAAAAKLGEGRRVAFLNLDTYRIGAAAQLETYARLLECPVLTAHTPEGVAAARRQFADYDLVLIDTTGRSPRSAEELRLLAELLDAAQPDEVHLLMDTRNSGEVHRSVLRGYRTLRPTHLGLCKLDELPAYGSIAFAEGLSSVLQPALETELPFSYLTMGQRVPEDVAPATSENLLACLSGSF